MSYKTEVSILPPEIEEKKLHELISKKTDNFKLKNGFYFKDTSTGEVYGIPYRHPCVFSVKNPTITYDIADWNDDFVVEVVPVNLTFQTVGG